MGKKWHIAFADYSWGQSTRDAYAAEIKKNGGEVVGTTGIPLGTADMTPFLSKISGDFDGLFGIFFGKDGVTVANQAYDLGLTKKYKWAGDGAICESTNLPAHRQQDRRLHRHQSLHPDLPGPARHAVRCTSSSTTPRRGWRRSIRPVRCPTATCSRTTRRMNAMKIAMVASKFQGRDDTPKLIEALEGLEMKEGDDFPQGDKTLRKEDHQAFLREFIFEVQRRDLQASRDGGRRTRRSSHRPASFSA